MVVQHNTSAMTANRYYGINNSALGKSLEKLSSGYAINRAGDNAAGLAVSEKMRAQIAGLTQASKNAQDGISMVQTYEGALQETDSILQRMRTIAVQSANGSYQNDVDRDALQLEFDQLNDELNQIADTDFNGVVVLNGGVMSDGTVVNDSTKVAERPEVANVETTPNAAFTYNTTVNGTVDSGANGSLTINGVNLKLKAGEGSATLGSAATGLTEYSTDDISVRNGKVSGTISAKETYKINEDTTSITIHGQTYSVGSDSIKDENGKTVNLIDGLSVSVSSGNNVTLQGEYSIVDSEIKIKTFQNNLDEEVTNANASATTYPSWDGNVSISGTSITYNSNGELNSLMTVNGSSVNVVNGTASATKGAVTYAIGTDAAAGDSPLTVDETSGKVTGTITASGTVAAASKVTADVDYGDEFEVTATYYDMDGNETTKDAFDTALGSSSANVGAYADYTFTEKVTGRSISVTKEIGAGGNIKLNTAKGGTDLTGANLQSGGGDFTIYADINGSAHKTAGTSSFSKFTINIGSDAADELTVKKQENSVASNAGLGNGVKIYTDMSGTPSKVLKVTGDNGAVINDTNASTVGLGNGLTWAAANGAIAGKFNVNVDLDVDKVGSFKVSQGVSTSDTFNHGTANLTYADNMTLQVGARSKDAVTFNFSYTTNGIGNLKSDLNASARGLGTDQVSVKNQEDANAAIDAIDNAINKVSMIRGTFGAIQNRLEHKINNIDTNAENLTAAESRIRDTQMDQEMMKFTSAQILSQASQSMLAQANSLPQGVLQLLG